MYIHKNINIYATEPPVYSSNLYIDIMHQGSKCHKDVSKQIHLSMAPIISTASMNLLKSISLQY